MNLPELNHFFASAHKIDPWFSLGLFLLASFLMIWRLGALEKNGLEGTVLGTLIMPYCSGLSNLIFAYFMGFSGGNGTLVLENCLVNNVTNLTLLIGLPAIFWSMHIIPQKPGKKKISRNQNKIHQLNRLAVLLTLIGMLFFTGVLWALARDKRLDLADGLVLVGLFFFWQIFHVFEVLKTNVRQERRLPWLMIIDIVLIVAGGYGVYTSIESLVTWISHQHSGFFVFKNLGWLSGFLMVMPNGLMAFYYAKIARPDIVYSSQIGDGHICIPMCVGLFALFKAIQIPAYFQLSIFILLGAGILHFFFILIFGRLPRFMGYVLTGAYLVFLYKGLISP